MQIEHLSLTNFRNYARLEMPLPSAPLVLCGDNAQGKTSLLEAVYYLATSKSPYTTSDRQLIHWRTEGDPMPHARLVAEMVSDGRFHRLETTILLNGAGVGGGRFKKVVKHNGVEKRVMDVAGLLKVVFFMPQDLALVHGAPADRRHFMNVTLSQVDRDYLAALDKYERLIPQRNALLKRIAERRASPNELSLWDEQIAVAGAVIIAARQRFLRELEVAAQRTHHQLTGDKETLSLQYQPSFTPTADGGQQLSFGVIGLDLHREIDADTIAPQFAARLEAERMESIHRGVTLSGPHRDELRLMINQRDAGLYGSRGQARTAVMSLKLAELAWMTERSGDPPVLLLDEVVAELDASRRAFLLDRIDGGVQTLLTTTELDIFTPSFLERAAVWHVADGQISTSATP